MKFLLLTSLLLLSAPFASADYYQYEEEWQSDEEDQDDYGAQEDQEEEDYRWELLSEEEVADLNNDDAYQEGEPVYSGLECESGARPYRVSVKHREGNGIGYPRGYSSLDGFFSYSYQGTVHPFVDLRAHLTNQGKWAYNAGVGLRTLMEGARTVFGINFFYDYRDGRHRQFNQVGGGLELLGKRWDFRLNGYIPVGESKKKYFDGFRKFKGNHALFAKRFEVAMYGGDIDLGVDLAKTKYWNLHAKLGGYYFHGDFGKMFGGGLFELATDITRYITLKGQVSYDNHFKWLGQGEAALNFPMGPHLTKETTTLSCGSLADLQDRLVEAVDRFEMIVTLKHRENTKAINPLTGNPLLFVFVDNTSHSAGTFESPFPTLAQAQNLTTPADIIYVFPGDGTDRGLNTGAVLQNNQGLIGSAAPLVVTTRFGLRTIPAQTIQNPIVSLGSNPASPNPTITLANNNNVSGLNIVANGTNGLQGSAVNGAFIAYNNFYEGTASAVSLSSAMTGNIVIANNNFFGVNATGVSMSTTSNMAVAIVNNQFATFTGVDMTPTAGTMVIAIVDNEFAPPPNGKINQAVVFHGQNATINLAIQNNVINNLLNSNASTGIDVRVDSSTLNTIISKNHLTNIGGAGINIENSNSISLINADVEENVVVNANAISGGGFPAGIYYNTGSNAIRVNTRLSGNISTALNGGFGYIILAPATNNMFIQSPNLQASGLEAINFGTFSLPANNAGITFVPFTYVPLF